MPADLLIANATVVTPSGRRRANIVVEDGRIVQLGPERPAVTETIDADGLFVLPGGVDTHVHLMDPGDTEREDFPSGTSAAAASGVTTIIEHTHGHPIRNVADLQAKRDYLRRRAHVDYGLAAHAWPGHSDDVAPLWAAGIAFFKVFTCTTHGVPGHDAAALLDHLGSTAALDAVSLIHCEDESLTESAEKVLRAAGRTDAAIVPEWRNREAELVAASVAALLVRRAGARATIAHVSNPEVASYIAAERRRGARLQAEGCPQYFLLREDEVLSEGALRKFTPPARARSAADESAMWALLREGVLTHMSSDHAPATRGQKLAGGIWDAHFGLPGLDSTMALLLDAVSRGELSLEDVATVYAERPAKIYGLWPRKGAIRAGADADLALVDMSEKRELRDSDVLSKAGWTPYDGRAVQGRVVRTILRGVTIASAGRVVHEFHGAFVPGGGTANKDEAGGQP
jgi:dihydroorotase (multifunctional complex type)